MPPSLQPLCPLTKWKEITCGWPAPLQFNVRVSRLINFLHCFLTDRHWGAMKIVKISFCLLEYRLTPTPLKEEKRIRLHHPAPSLLNVSPCVPPTAPPIIYAIIDSLLSVRAGGHGVQLYLIWLISDQTSATASRRSIILIHFQWTQSHVTQQPYVGTYICDITCLVKSALERVMAPFGFMIFGLSSGHSHRRSSDHAPVHRVGDSSRGGRERQPPHLPRSHLPHQSDRTRPQQTRRTRLSRVRLRPGSGSERQHNLQHHQRQRGREVRHWPEDRYGVLKEDGDGRKLRHPHCKLDF